MTAIDFIKALMSFVIVKNCTFRADIIDEFSWRLKIPKAIEIITLFAFMMIAHPMCASSIFIIQIDYTAFKSLALTR